MVAVHRATPRNAELVSRVNSDRGRASRLRAAASRVGDAPTGRALKRVRFAADRVEDDAETPEATSASASSCLPAEDATTTSLPAHSSEAVLPASAVEVLDQVMMSEGLKQRDFILVTPCAMLSCFWTILMSVERLNSVVKSVVGKRRFSSM